SLADAIRCLTFSLPPSSSVTLKNSYVHDVSYFALELQRCDLVIDRSQLGPANASGAVSMTYGNYSITNAFIVGNGGPAMVFSESAAGVFSHDTVVGNVTNGSTGGFNCSATGVTAIDNSIVWMNSKLNGSQLYGTCALTNVDIDEVVGGAGNRSVAPDFVSAGFDYHLGGRTANNLACCVDQIVASAVDHDYDGRARPVGGKWDVGAHEVPERQRPGWCGVSCSGGSGRRCCGISPLFIGLASDAPVRPSARCARSSCSSSVGSAPRANAFSSGSCASFACFLNSATSWSWSFAI